MRIVFFTIILSLAVSCVNAQAEFDYYISNAGNDANSGTSNAPKRTIAGVGNAVSSSAPFPGNFLKVGLRSGDIFNETFSPGFPVYAGTYFPSGGRNFAILKGSQDCNTGWLWQRNTIYHQRIALNGAFRGYGIGNIGSYSFVYVFEIDRQLEVSSPITARRMLKFVSTIEAAIATPGSFYSPLVSNVDSVDIFMHPSDGGSPNNHSRFRYEVSKKDWAINSTYQQNNHFEKLWITGYGAGNGMIPAGANTTFNRMIFGPGAAIHHLGLRGAFINNSLFLPGPHNTNGYAVVFYDVQGYRRHNSIKNSIFMDIPAPVYTHKSNGVNFNALELDNVIAFADTTEAGSFIATSDTDSIILKNVYCDKYPHGYAYGRGRYVSIKNSVFKDATMGIGFPGIDLAATINNNYIRISNVRNGVRASGINMNVGNRIVAANNIVHFKNEHTITSSEFAGYLLGGTGAENSYADISGNIFICDVAPENYVVVATANTNSGAGTGSDRWRNNVYILVKGSRLEWRVTNRVSNNGRNDIVDFQQWKIQSGEDANSLFFDLRNDPRGLKAIFVDPDNGDYTIANTIEGNAIRSIRAGMINPITCFLKRPSYEEAAKIIMNDGVLTANACRNPCNQNNIRIENRLSSTLSGNKRILLNWHIADESAVDHYEVMRSFGNNDFSTIASIPATTEFDYAFTDSNMMPGINYRYSIALITKRNDKCYSAVTSIKTEDGRPVNVYPNPSTGKIYLGLNAYTGPVKVTIHNVMGRVVYSKEIIASYGVPVSIDLSRESKGFYWINVQADGTNAKQGLILQ